MLVFNSFTHIMHTTLNSKTKNNYMYTVHLKNKFTIEKTFTEPKGHWFTNIVNEIIKMMGTYTKSLSKEK